MVSASSKDALKDKLKGIHCVLECQDMCDVEKLEVLKEVSKNDFVDDMCQQHAK